jgi:hypothetical protein
MGRSFVLRISTALAVVATAGTMLVVSGTAATATQGQPILAGVGGQHESGTTQLVQDGNVSGLDVTANTGGRAIGGFSSSGMDCTAREPTAWSARETSPWMAAPPATA